MSATSQIEKALPRAANSGGRARSGRAALQSFRGWKHAATGKPRAPWSKRHRKLELMEQARRAGWKGSTFASAKKFERKLERQLRAGAR